MTQMDTFQAQQTLAYLQGRKAFNTGRSLQSSPYVATSVKAEAWMNGWRDASQGLGANGFQGTSLSPIPSSEYRHIDRSDSDPIAECHVCRWRLAFQHYHGMPVCFVCQANASWAGTVDWKRGVEAIMMARRVFQETEVAA